MFFVTLNKSNKYAIFGTRMEKKLCHDIQRPSKGINSASGATPIVNIRTYVKRDKLCYKFQNVTRNSELCAFQILSMTKRQKLVFSDDKLKHYYHHVIAISVSKIL